MYGQYWDNRAKRLLDEAPQDFLDWLLQGALFTGQRSLEFESRTFEADAMHEIIYQDKPMLFHLEFQSGPDTAMALRLLEYCVLAYRRYGYPVCSIVLYLKKGGKVAVSPLVLTLPTGEEVLRFNFRVIELADIPYKEMMAQGLPGILPLVPLTNGGAQREVIEEIITRLIPPEGPARTELLALTRLFASLAFNREDDQEWLKRRFEMLKDILRETPAFQQILEEGRQEGREIGLQEGLQEGLNKGLQEGLNKGLQELALERQRHMQSLRQKLLNMLQVRYADLTTIAQKQLPLIEEPEILEEVFFKIAVATNIEEARAALLDWQ